MSPPPDPPRTTSGFDRESLAAAYGPVQPDHETFEVPTGKYEAVRSGAAAGALGGARALVHRGREALESVEDPGTVLVSNRGEPGWDVPGGAREPGESPEETALREVREEVGLDVRLLDLLWVREFGFVPETRDDDRVAGLWVYFEAATTDPDPALDVQTVELDDAGWFAAPPGELDAYAAPLARDCLGWDV